MITEIVHYDHPIKHHLKDGQLASMYQLYCDESVNNAWPRSLNPEDHNSERFNYLSHTLLLLLLYSFQNSIMVRNTTFYHSSQDMSNAFLYHVQSLI